MRPGTLTIMGKQSVPVASAPDAQRSGEAGQAGQPVREKDQPVREKERTEPVRRVSWVAWASLLTVWVAWGSTYLAIRVGVETIPPLLLAAARTLTAGLIMFPLAMRSRRQ